MGKGGDKMSRPEYLKEIPVNIPYVGTEMVKLGSNHEPKRLPKSLRDLTFIERYRLTEEWRLGQRENGGIINLQNVVSRSKLGK